LSQDQASERSRRPFLSIRAVFWHGVFVALGCFTYYGIQLHFERHLIPLPAWPYALSLSLLTFCALKAIYHHMRGD